MPRSLNSALVLAASLAASALGEASCATRYGSDPAQLAACIAAEDQGYLQMLQVNRLKGPQVEPEDAAAATAKYQTADTRSRDTEEDDLSLTGDFKEDMDWMQKAVDEANQANQVADANAQQQQAASLLQVAQQRDTEDGPANHAAPTLTEGDLIAVLKRMKDLVERWNLGAEQTKEVPQLLEEVKEVLRSGDLDREAPFTVGPEHPILHWIAEILNHHKGLPAYHPPEPVHLPAPVPPINQIYSGPVPLLPTKDEAEAISPSSGAYDLKDKTDKTKKDSKGSKDPKKSASKASKPSAKKGPKPTPSGKGKGKGPVVVSAPGFSTGGTAPVNVNGAGSNVAGATAGTATGDADTAGAATAGTAARTSTDTSAGTPADTSAGTSSDTSAGTSADTLDTSASGATSTDDAGKTDTAKVPQGELIEEMQIMMAQDGMPVQTYGLIIEHQPGQEEAAKARQGVAPPPLDALLESAAAANNPWAPILKENVFQDLLRTMIQAQEKQMAAAVAERAHEPHEEDVVVPEVLMFRDVPREELEPVEMARATAMAEEADAPARLAVPEEVAYVEESGMVPLPPGLEIPEEPVVEEQFVFMPRMPMA